MGLDDAGRHGVRHNHEAGGSETLVVAATDETRAERHVRRGRTRHGWASLPESSIKATSRSGHVILGTWVTAITVSELHLQISGFARLTLEWNCVGKERTAFDDLCPPAGFDYY